MKFGFALVSFSTQHGILVPKFEVYTYSFVQKLQCLYGMLSCYCSILQMCEYIWNFVTFSSFRIYVLGVTIE